MRVDGFDAGADASQIVLREKIVCERVEAEFGVVEVVLPVLAHLVLEIGGEGSG